jgi:hypothetical protein
VGHYLTERAVRLSWQLDRADGHERARLAARVHRVPKERERARRRKIDGLMRRLLHAEVEPPAGPAHSYYARGHSTRTAARKVSADAEPSVLLGKLEGSAEGCRRLLAEWRTCLQVLQEWLEDDASPSWGVIDRNRLVRLFGYRVEEADALAAVDRRIAVILHTQKLAEDLAIDQFWARKSKEEHDEDAPEYVPPPPRVVADPSLEPVRLKREFQSIVQQQCARLEDLLAAHEAEEADDPGDIAEESAFDDSAEGERLHRYQVHWHRSLLRTLDAIAKLRKSEEQEAPGEPGPGDRGARFQSCHSVDEETAIPARQDCPKGMESPADDTGHPVRIKATATTEQDDHERTYAVAGRCTETRRPAAKRRLKRFESDAGEPRPCTSKRTIKRSRRGEEGTGASARSELGSTGGVPIVDGG